MIVIQVKVATISLFSLAAMLLNVAPAVLGLILATHEYAHPTAHHTAIQAPAALTAASALVCVLSHAAGVAWPYKFSVAFTNAAAAALLGASGTYFVVELLRHATGLVVSAAAKNAVALRIETAFVVLWLACVLVNVAVPFFALGALYVAMGGPNSDLDVLSMTSAPPNDAELLFEKPMPPSSSSPLQQHQHYMPGSDPLSEHFPLDDPLQLSPHLSWASSIRSFDTVPPPLAQAQAQAQAEALGASSIVLTPQHLAAANVPNLPPGPQPSSPPSPSPKTPRSPLRVHLSKSSFSLKRAGSKASLASPRGAQAPHAAAHPHPHPHPHPHTHTHTHTHLQSPLRAAASSIVLGGSEGAAAAAAAASSQLDLKPPKSWVIIPNENTAESRSVSGSSQLTGRIFPAAEYNRKLNAAGFERDEPVPVHVQVVRPAVSQYDLEQMHRQRDAPNRYPL